MTSQFGPVPNFKMKIVNLKFILNDSWCGNLRKKSIKFYKGENKIWTYILTDRFQPVYVHKLMNIH